MCKVFQYDNKNTCHHISYLCFVVVFIVFIYLAITERLCAQFNAIFALSYYFFALFSGVPPMIASGKSE